MISNQSILRYSLENKYDHEAYRVYENMAGKYWAALKKAELSAEKIPFVPPGPAATGVGFLFGLIGLRMKRCNDVAARSK